MEIPDGKTPRPIEEIAQEFDQAMKKIDSQLPKDKSGLTISARVFLQISQSGHPAGKSPEVESGIVQDGEFD